MSCGKRNIALLSGLLLLGLSTIACSPPVSPASSMASGSESQVADPTPAIANSGQNSGQMLPISAQVKVADQMIQLEVARTAAQQELGLMYRKELDANRGMLFSFTPARPVGFWMKNTLIDLDMVFMHNGRVVAVSSNVPPCKTDPCPVYGPQEAVDQVIELRGGRAAELEIKSGDRLTIQHR